MTTFPKIPYTHLPPPFSTHPYLCLLAPTLLLLTVLLTRLFTTLRFRLHSSNSLSPATLPYSIPFLAHVPAMASDFQAFIAAQSRQYPDHPAFALTLGNSRHNVLISPSLVHQVLAKREMYEKVNMHEMIFRVVKTFWGDQKEEMRNTLSEEALWGDIHGVLQGMMREDFVKSSLAATVKAVENKIPEMVSGVKGPVDMERWERAAEVEVEDAQNGRQWVAEANLFYLLRDFVGDLATAVLMGREFLANFPDIVDDLWTADAALNLFLIGMPNWLPRMHAPVRARNRILDAVREHHIAYVKYARGEDPGTKWGDMDDVSSVMRDRAMAWENGGASADVAAKGDASIVWAMNINSPPLIFWMVWYIFSSPTLLQEIREEVAPYVKVRKQDGTGTGAVKEKEKVEIDLDGLRMKCPLLQGVFLETMRLETASTSYKYVDQDIVIKESAEDARVFGRPKDDIREYIFKKGEYVCIPHGVHQRDERYFDNPDQFNPRRFWVTKNANEYDPDETLKSNANPELEKTTTDKSQIRVDYKTMKVWGGGKEMCKGKKFAEGEVVLFVAAVVMFWDIEPVGQEPWYAGLGEDLGGVLKIQGKKGEWRHPGRKQGTGAVQPLRMRDCRVRLWRRTVEAE